MAKLDDSIVSHVTISEGIQRNETNGDDEIQMRELISGIESREKLLLSK